MTDLAKTRALVERLRHLEARVDSLEQYVRRLEEGMARSMKVDPGRSAFLQRLAKLNEDQPP